MLSSVGFLVMVMVDVFAPGPVTLSGGITRT